VLSTLVLPFLIGGFALTVLFFYFFKAVPLSSEIGAKPTVILDATGQTEFATLQPEFAREEVPIDEICQRGRRHVCDAVLAAEDAGFYQHGGVSIPGIVRAALRNVVKGEIVEGGSTISQQYIKTITGDNEQTPLRKVREAAQAMKLEKEYSKDEILELYLNSIYFGRGAYGIQAAAQAYFNTDAKDLDVAQAAQLAGVIPAPSAYDPLENPEAAGRRYRYVLDRMLALGWIDAMEAGRLYAQPPTPVEREDIRFNDAPFFVDIVRQELERELGDEIYTGLRVTTTLNLGVQQRAKEAYDEAFSGIDPTGALVALDPTTGGIVALIGGENYQTDQFNLATAPRQAGSTFKPFALAAWLEENKSPESYFDAPAKIVLPQADDGSDWTVNNYEKAEYPPMTLRQATWNSVNTVYAQVQDQVGARATANIASRAMGLGGKDAFEPYASLVLGTAEITPLQLAEAYNTFASGGVHHSAFAVVEARRGDDVVYRHEDDADRAISERVALAVTDVLQGVISDGSGHRARFGHPAAGKTGTTQDYGDAWFAGYTPSLTAVVWMGNRDNNQTMPGHPTGGDLPAITWGRFMSSTSGEFPVAKFPEPDLTDLIVVRGKPADESDLDSACQDGGQDGEIAIEQSSEEDVLADVSSDASSESSPPDCASGEDALPFDLPGLPAAQPLSGDDSDEASEETRDEDSSAPRRGLFAPGFPFQGPDRQEERQEAGEVTEEQSNPQIQRGEDGRGSGSGASATSRPSLTQGAQLHAQDLNALHAEEE